MTMSDPTPRVPASDPRYVPNRASVSLPAIEHNTRQLHSLLGEQTALMAIMKADAYGHGMIEAASAALAATTTNPARPIATAKNASDATTGPFIRTCNTPAARLSSHLRGDVGSPARGGP